jgi:hypothetical protein
VECTREEYYSEKFKILVVEFEYIHVFTNVTNPAEISKEKLDYTRYTGATLHLSVTVFEAEY